MDPTVAGGLISTGGSFLSSIVNKIWDDKSAINQRNWNEKMMDKQNQWSLDMWNKTNEYNSPGAQVARLRDAGLNPLSYGLDGSSANNIQSAQALGYDRSSMPAISNPGQDYLQGKLLAQQIELAKANEVKAKEESSGLALDNEFKQRTMDSRVEGEELANKLTKSQIEKIEDERKQIAANIQKTIAETESESERKLLIQAQRWVQEATAQEIISLLPYKQRLMDAQTEAQKAAAMASFYSALYNKKMIDSGYIDELVRRAKADADSSEAVASLRKFESSIKTGNTFEIYDDDWLVTKAGKKFLNAAFQDISILGQLLAGPIGDIVSKAK